MVTKPGLSSVVGAHDRFQPQTWKQVHGEEALVNLGARKLHTTLPTVAVTHPYSATQTPVRTWSRKGIWFIWMHNQGKKRYVPNQHI